MSEFLKLGNGNAKLDTAIGIFDLPAGHTCPFAKDCLARVNYKTGKLIRGEEAKSLLDDLKLYGGEFNELSILMEYSLEDYASWVVKRNNYYTDSSKKLTYLNVVEKPEVPVKKSYPVRWVILLSVIMGTLLFAVVLLSLFQKK